MRQNKFDDVIFFNLAVEKDSVLKWDHNIQYDYSMATK